MKKLIFLFLMFVSMYTYAQLPYKYPYEWLGKSSLSVISYHAEKDNECKTGIEGEYMFIESYDEFSKIFHGRMICTRYYLKDDVVIQVREFVYNIESVYIDEFLEQTYTNITNRLSNESWKVIAVSGRKIAYIKGGYKAILNIEKEHRHEKYATIIDFMKS